MDDTDLPVHSGIPLGHKLFAVLIALAVAGAGCAWLLHQSGQSASAAVLAFDPALAQQADPGIASSRNPAVELADSFLNDQTVGNLAKQAHLAASSPAGQIGEFRSDLQLTQPSAQRLDVRFLAADSAQSLAVADAVARALVAWTPASTAPAAPPQAAVPSPAPAPQPADQGQANPPLAASASPQPTPSSEGPAAPPLSQTLQALAAQLSVTNQRLDQLAEDEAAPSYGESMQQSILRNEVGQARRTLAGLRSRHARELAEPAVGAAVAEIQQALDSILPGGHRGGFNAAGVSGPELSAERSELRQTIRIVNRETGNIQLAEAVHPLAAAPQASPPASPAQPPTPSSSSAATAAQSSAPLPSRSTAPSAIQEQNITPTGAPVPQPSSQNPFSMVRLAGPAPRPPFWPALVAGAAAGLLYFGIAAWTHRRREADGLDLDFSGPSRRMITPAEEASAAVRDTPRAETTGRQRAAFDFRPDASGDVAAPVEEPAAPPENRP